MVKHSKIYYEKLASLFGRCFLFLFTFFGAQLGYWVNFVIDGKLHGQALYLFLAAMIANCLICGICLIAEFGYLIKVDKIELSNLNKIRNNFVNVENKASLKRK